MAMLTRAADTCRVITRLLEQGCAIALSRDGARFTVAVVNGKTRAKYFDGGNLEACVAQIDPSQFMETG